MYHLLLVHVQSTDLHLSFIVGQVTPDMFTGITYGTFILFGILIMMGAAFIFFFFVSTSVPSSIIIMLTVSLQPETKGLSLEEMDILLGSVGVAAADAERMREINREVGLDNAIRHASVDHSAGLEKPVLDEKIADTDSD